jgi:hypothetical protein
LVKIYEKKFKYVYYTIHELKSGETKGKHTNVNCSLESMEPLFDRLGIRPEEVMFTSVDSDSWLPEAYLEELEYFLSQHGWEMERYMFSPNQTYAMNRGNIPLLNKLADCLLGMGQFAWCRTLTNIQPVVGNYSLSYSTMKKIGFFDGCADGIIDDYHLTCKAMWKTKGDLYIVPLNVMTNTMSLATGRSWLYDFKARFWQAERHMMTMLDAAYNLNMFFKSPLRWRTSWFVVAFMQNNFISLGLYLTTFIFLVFKLATESPFSD